MRFKKGSRVELFSKNEVPTGAWLCAEIISGNGHTYSVQYKHLSIDAESVVERVPRKAIRPCPPPVEGLYSWVPGDIVEAFHNSSWKMARIVKAMGGEQFLVSILGLGLSKSCFHKSYLRVRQSWEDDKWFVIGKGLEIDGISIVENSTKKAKKHVRDESFRVEKNTKLKITWKRGSQLGSQDLEAHLVPAQKKRLVEKGCSHQQIYSLHCSPTSEKVDAVLGENHMNSSFNIATPEFFVLDTSRRSDSYASLDTDSCASSSGSCNSMGNDAQNLPFRCSTEHGNNVDDYFSDAESSCGVQYKKKEPSPYSGKKTSLGFRRSGLDTYRFAIEDLYALGPLSWEDEAKLTHLRHVLHVSDDEHLMMLRNLKSIS